MRPGVLILDEPTAGLDPAGREEILENIQEYHRATGSTILLVTHSMEDIARIAERLIVFDGGTIALDGTAEEVFSQAERLQQISLAVPDSTSIAMRLRARGVPIKKGIYTTEQLVQAVLACKKEGNRC